MNLVDILKERAASCPNAPAIVDLGGGTRRALTFAQLDETSARVAGVLRDSGLKPGDTVLLFQPMSADLYVALLGVLRCGMTAMFIDPSAGIASVRTACRHHPPAALIGTPKAHLLRILAPELRAIPRKFTMGPPFPGARSLTNAGDAEPLADSVSRNESAPALLTFTSGSTAQPKAVLRTHGFVLAQYRALQDNIALEPGEIDLTTLPLFLLANLAAGITSVIPDADLRSPGKAPPDRIAAAIREHGATRTAASPALLERLADHCLAQGITLTSMRKIYTGGAPVFPRVLEKLQRVAPRAHVAAVYGSTEAEPITHLDWSRVESRDLEDMYSGKGLLAGEPVPEIRLRILEDRWGRSGGDLDAAQFGRLALPRGVPGEIVVSGDHVLTRYLDAKGEEETKIRVGDVVWHRTGDAGYLDERGRLWLLGRCGTQVDGASGALYPFAVECAASQFPGVRRSALFEDANRRRVLAVEGNGSLPGLDELEESLSWAKLDSIRPVRGIPVDARHNAKVDYTALKAHL
jgi:acyl-CoA synthetase (AMP-forming)/AMP-acid ligase II